MMWCGQPHKLTTATVYPRVLDAPDVHVVDPKLRFAVTHAVPPEIADTTVCDVPVTVVVNAPLIPWCSV